MGLHIRGCKLVGKQDVSLNSYIVITRDHETKSHIIFVYLFYTTKHKFHTFILHFFTQKNLFF